MVLGMEIAKRQLHQPDHRLQSNPNAADGRLDRGLMTFRGFREIHHVRFGHTKSGNNEITELDSRPDESFFIECFR